MKWEYKTTTLMLIDLKSVEDWLNAEGNDGWELVSIVANVHSQHYSHFHGHFAVLKRPK